MVSKRDSKLNWILKTYQAFPSHVKLMCDEIKREIVKEEREQEWDMIHGSEAHNALLNLMICQPTFWFVEVRRYLTSEGYDEFVNKVKQYQVKV
jgi:hypothetical protein